MAQATENLTKFVTVKNETADAILEAWVMVQIPVLTEGHETLAAEKARTAEAALEILTSHAEVAGQVVSTEFSEVIYQHGDFAAVRFY